MTEAKPSTAESPRGRRDPKAVSLNNRPELRQHQSNFYLNFVTKGIGHEMAQNRRGHEEEHIDAADVNRAKQYSLGMTATNPPYHIHGDGDRVVGAGRFNQVRQRLTAALKREDTNRDGCVSFKELCNAVHTASDPFMTLQALDGLWRLLDPLNTGKVDIETAVGATIRNLATRPSQRQTVGAGNILAWADDGSCKNPAAREAVRLGGSFTPRIYYGVEAESIAPPTAAREAQLPGLMPVIAGLTSGARGDKSKQSSPRQPRGGASPRSSQPAAPPLPSPVQSPRKRSPPTRSVLLRDQFVKQQEQLADSGRKHSHGFVALPVTHSSPRNGIVSAPKPGLYLVSH